MPRLGTRFLAGMAAALALGACSALPDAAAPSPAAQPPASPAYAAATASATWAQDLTFAGDLGGRLTGVVPNQAGQRSECTGPQSKATGQWAMTLFGLVGQGVYGLVVTESPYRGPGTYAGAVIEVHSADQRGVWQTQPGDPVAFRVNNDEQSGTLDATLTNLADARSKLKVAGAWSCRS